jgi:hypothetical protein
MAQTITFVAVLAALALLVTFRKRLFHIDTVVVRLRLDRSLPGAHLMWHIGNAGAEPITVTKLIVHTGPRGADRPDTVALSSPHVLGPGEHVLLPTDVDWSLLAATAIAVADASGREHRVSRRQLRAIHDQLRPLIDRRDYDTRTARDWLIVSTDMAFGVVILGLGFFMLMWVIYTG